MGVTAFLFRRSKVRNSHSSFLIFYFLHNPVIQLEIHEVYYDESKTPNGYTENANTGEGENMKDITGSQ